jgi:hypothetical protein
MAGNNMTGSIIDAEKLQNEQFIKKDFCIFANGHKMMISFDVFEKDVKSSVAHYNKVGRVTGVMYSYKPVKVNMEVIE